SGTTGPPKGVMLSHNNVAWTARAAAELIGAGPADALLSYLPLSHIAEQMFSIHIPITAGYAVYFAESMEKLPDNLKEVQPTLFFAVPRIYEKFYAGVQSKLEAAPDLRRKLVALAQRIGTVHNDAANRGELPHPVVDLVYGAAQTVIFDKLKTALGLGRARVCVTGAAPIAAEIIEFFASLDIVIREVYGQSEGCGPTSFNVAGRTRFGSVGPAFPGVDVVIADDGEIKVSGPNVFMGYFKDAEATAETLVDGWLHSGDLGRIDSDGFLHITGRKKDLIITAGGKNIAPKNIEAALKDHPLVGEAVVIGDRRKFLTALIALDAERAEAKSAELGVSLEDLGDHPTIRADLERHVEAVNEHLARVEQVKRFSVLPRPFTPQSGELTPTLTVKRRVVSERYAEAIENMYGGDLEDRAKAS
ncbi:MAG: AMP-dependent synthetase/ligase, partial [Myxococcota bacterium]